MFSFMRVVMASLHRNRKPNWDTIEEERRLGQAKAAEGMSSQAALVSKEEGEMDSHWGGGGGSQISLFHSATPTNLVFQFSIFNLTLLIGLMSTGSLAWLGALAVTPKFESDLSSYVYWSDLPISHLDAQGVVCLVTDNQETFLSWTTNKMNK